MPRKIAKTAPKAKTAAKPQLPKAEPSKRLTDAEKLHILELLEAGHPVAAISRVTGRSKKVIRKVRETHVPKPKHSPPPAPTPKVYPVRCKDCGELRHPNEPCSKCRLNQLLQTPELDFWDELLGPILPPTPASEPTSPATSTEETAST